jgi:hypothetical protein
MIAPGLARPLCILLGLLTATPASFAQAPAPSGQPKPAAPEAIPSPLSITALEGNNAVNSIPLLSSVTPVVEIKDQNEFPVEGATVVFTMPENGPGGRFAGSRLTFTTKSDSHGQASAPFVVNNLAGKFQIKVTANAGSRKGELSINQTNSAGAYIGPALPQRHWYTGLHKKWYVWAIAGGAVAGTVIALKSGGGSSSTPPPTITITPGGPTFGGPH